MKPPKALKILSITLAALLVIVMIPLFIDPGVPDPHYQNKPLSEWLKDLGSGRRETQTRAEEAIRSIGTNALPMLLNELRSQDHLGWRVWHRILPRKAYTVAADRIHPADRALRVLGPEAEAALPALLQIAADPRCGDDRPRRALAAIGPRAVTPMICALTNSNERVRSCAALVLTSTGPSGRDAAPALLRSLTDSDARVRAHAAGALSRIEADPKIVVPALTERLSDTDSYVRFCAVMSLGEFGERATSAVPALRRLESDQSPKVRQQALDAVRRIEVGTLIK
jgi:HEAT repeat protein